MTLAKTMAEDCCATHANSLAACGCPDKWIMSSSTSSEKLKLAKGENPYDASHFYFFAGSLGVMGAGMLTGCWIAMRHLKEKENFHFDIRKHRQPAVMAARALGYGTLLCLGTFGVLGAGFCYAADIRNLRDFDVFMRGSLKLFEPPVNKDPQVQRERELVDKLTEDQQLEYVWKKYFEEEAQVAQHIHDGPMPPKVIPEKDRSIVEQIEYIRSKYFD